MTPRSAAILNHDVKREKPCKFVSCTMALISSHYISLYKIVTEKSTERIIYITYIMKNHLYEINSKEK